MTQKTLAKLEQELKRQFEKDVKKAGDDKKKLAKIFEEYENKKALEEARVAQVASLGEFLNAMNDLQKLRSIGASKDELLSAQEKVTKVAKDLASVNQTFNSLTKLINKSEMSEEIKTWLKRIIAVGSVGVSLYLLIKQIISIANQPSQPGQPGTVDQTLKLVADALPGIIGIGIAAA